MEPYSDFGERQANKSRPAPSPEMMTQSLAKAINNIQYFQAAIDQANSEGSVPEKIKSLQDVEAKILETKDIVNNIDNQLNSLKLQKEKLSVDPRNILEITILNRQIQEIEETQKSPLYGVAPDTITQALDQVRISIHELKKIEMITFITPDHLEFKIPKDNLISLSKKFKQAFEYKAESKSEKYPIDTSRYTKEEVHAFFRFLESGEIDFTSLTRENVLALYELADEHWVEALLKECFEYIKENLEGIPELVFMGIQRNRQDLVDYCFNFIEKHDPEMIVPLLQMGIENEREDVINASLNFIKKHENPKIILPLLQMGIENEREDVIKYCNNRIYSYKDIFESSLERKERSSNNESELLLTLLQIGVGSHREDIINICIDYVKNFPSIDFDLYQEMIKIISKLGVENHREDLINFCVDFYKGSVIYRPLNVLPPPCLIPALLQMSVEKNDPRFIWMCLCTGMQDPKALLTDNVFQKENLKNYSKEVKDRIEDLQELANLSPPPNPEEIISGLLHIGIRRNRQDLMNHCVDFIGFQYDSKEVMKMIPKLLQVGVTENNKEFIWRVLQAGMEISWLERGYPYPEEFVKEYSKEVEDLLTDFRVLDICSPHPRLMERAGEIFFNSALKIETLSLLRRTSPLLSQLFNEYRPEVPPPDDPRLYPSDTLATIGKLYLENFRVENRFVFLLEELQRSLEQDQFQPRTLLEPFAISCLLNRDVQGLTEHENKGLFLWAMIFNCLEHPHDLLADEALNEKNLENYTKKIKCIIEELKSLAKLKISASSLQIPSIEKLFPISLKFRWINAEDFKTIEEFKNHIKQLPQQTQVFALYLTDPGLEFTDNDLEEISQKLIPKELFLVNNSKITTIPSNFNHLELLTCRRCKNLQGIDTSAKFILIKECCDNLLKIVAPLAEFCVLLQCRKDIVLNVPEECLIIKNRDDPNNLTDDIEIAHFEKMELYLNNIESEFGPVP